MKKPQETNPTVVRLYEFEQAVPEKHTLLVKDIRSVIDLILELSDKAIPLEYLWEIRNARPKNLDYIMRILQGEDVKKVAESLVKPKKRPYRTV
jgi:hypothetical protein